MVLWMEERSQSQGTNQSEKSKIFSYDPQSCTPCGTDRLKANPPHSSTFTLGTPGKNAFVLSRAKRWKVPDLMFPQVDAFIDLQVKLIFCSSSESLNSCRLVWCLVKANAVLLKKKLSVQRPNIFSDCSFILQYMMYESTIPGCHCLEISFIFSKGFGDTLVFICINWHMVANFFCMCFSFLYLSYLPLSTL